MTATLDDFRVGERVWSLVHVGTPYDVAAVDESRAALVLEPEPQLGGGPRPVTIPESFLWLVTKEHWDQIWYWPDRCGETFDTVVARFTTRHAPGDVITGQYYDDGLPLGSRGFITPDPATSMSFRLHPAQQPFFPQIPVEPIVEVGGEIVSAGPIVPLRVGMTSYRWSLAFGELILNWQDFLPPEG